MKKSFGIGILLALFGLIWGCSSSDIETERRIISTLESKLQELDPGFAPQGDSALLATAENLGARYIAFADAWPEAPETPDYLYRAGELYYHDLGDHATATATLERCHREYPDHKTAPHAVFLIAWLQHNVLKNLMKARDTYELFLEKYPEHEMAPAARFELEQLGVPDRDILNHLPAPPE